MEKNVQKRTGEQENYLTLEDVELSWTERKLLLLLLLQLLSFLLHWAWMLIGLQLHSHEPLISLHIHCRIGRSSRIHKSHSGSTDSLRLQRLICWDGKEERRKRGRNEKSSKNSMQLEWMTVHAALPLLH